MFFSLKYLSRLDFIFNPRHDSNYIKVNLENQSQDRSYLDSLPWILKQTLFLENDVLTKLRDLGDIGTVIFVTDDTKIKGNKSYDQGNYYEALDIYEQVLACFTWLQFRDQTLKDRIFSDPTLDENRICKVGILDEDVDYHERRVIIEADRDIETDTSRLDCLIPIEMSMIVSTLHNAMLAYMSVFHFEEALKCVDLILDNYH